MDTKTAVPLFFEIIKHISDAPFKSDEQILKRVKYMLEIWADANIRDSRLEVFVATEVAEMVMQVLANNLLPLINRLL